MRVVRLALVLLAITPAPLAAAIPAAERDALVALHQATGGPAWIVQSGWLGAPGSECSWYGVGCDQDGAAVVELSLPANNLVGALPAKLSSLASLRYLDLGDNALTGTIGAEITALPKLETLYLGRNRMSGPIPASIGAMRALRVLALDANELEGPVPPEIGQLTRLEELYLQSNRFSSLPSSIGSLLDLVVLDAADNVLSGPIPGELGALTALEALFLSSNLLSGRIPGDLGRMTALRDLRLSYNALTGEIPKELGALSQLEMFDLAANRLSNEIPPELGQLSALRTLSLYDNELEGGIPASLFKLTALEDLYLGANELSGSIPAGISGLTSLRYLALGGNDLRGPIPPQLGSMVALESIELYDNELTGGIPLELTGLANLRWLDLGGNELAGAIPAALANLSRLEALSLYHNGFSGPIPRELGQLVELESLYLGGNLLTGSIPGELGALTKLSVLHLGDNRLSGEIPEWIGNLTSLRELILGTNELSGPIPASITRLTALTYLDFGGNRLTGTIPSDIGNLHALEYLTLGYNFLDGQIPSGLWSLENMIDLRLDGLELSGSLPADVGNLARLEVLLLGDNDLSGSIPPAIGNLSKLQVLSLGLNRLTGTIPRELGNLADLLYLDLSLNALTGPIPAEIKQLTALKGSGSDFDYNALFTTDLSVAAFVDAAQYDGNFRDTQTVTPTGLRIASSTDRNLIVEWTPIAFVDGEGGYRVTVSKPGGPVAAVTMTPSKEMSSTKVRGLSASTQYSVTIAAITHPDGWRKNVVVSPDSAPVSGSTGPAVTAPADVDVSATAKGLIQIDGVAANEDSFTLTNFGDAATTVSLERNGDFFTIAPVSVALAGGASQTVTIKSLAQPAGGYWGDVWFSGPGVPEDLYVPVTLLSVSRPAGAVIAEAVTARIEVTGLPGTDSVGSARFRNRGTAPLAGVVISDVSWLVPEPQPIAIAAGETGAVSFTVVRSRRPAAAGDSALTGTLTLVYVDGSPSEDSSGKGAATTGTVGVSKTLVTVVDVPKPKVGTSPIPALAPGEVAFFVPGIATVPGASRSLVSDLGIANAYGTRAIDDLKVYYARVGSASVSVATIASIATESAISLANVIPNVYGSSVAEIGTLQLRSSSLDRLVVHGRLLNLAAAGGSLLGEIPIVRSDRSARPTETIVLPGLAKTATIATDLFIQETSGAPAIARVELLDAAGATLGAPQTIALDAFATAAIADFAPAGAVTAVVTHGGTGGRLAAHARVSDSATGDLWSVVDWSRNQQRVVRSAALRIPTVASSQGGSARKRLVARNSSAGITAASATGRVTTELWLHNPGQADSLVELALVDLTGRRRTAGVTLGPRTTRHYADVVFTIAGAAASGSLEITPKRGELAVFARLRIEDPACGSCGAVLPVVPAGSGLRAGQTQRFSGLESASAATVSARKPGTFRTGFGIVETSGSPVKIRASLKLADGRSPVSKILFRNVTLAAGSSVTFDDLAEALYGAARGENDLHDLQVDFEAIEGSGSAVVWVTSTDNATGDTIVRTE